MTKTVSPDTVQVGDTLTYRVTVRNLGLSTADDVVYTDSGTCEESLPIVCRLGSLAAGSEVTITVKMRAEEAGPPGNTGVAPAPNPDPNHKGPRTR